MGLRHAFDDLEQQYPELTDDRIHLAAWTCISITGDLDIIHLDRADELLELPQLVHRLPNRIREMLDDSYGPAGWPERERNLVETGARLAVYAMLYWCEIEDTSRTLPPPS